MMPHTGYDPIVIHIQHATLTDCDIVQRKDKN